MSGYCYPIRFDALKASGAITPDQAAKLPDTTGAVYPTGPQLDAAKALITGQWDTVVGCRSANRAPGNAGAVRQRGSLTTRRT